MNRILTATAAGIAGLLMMSAPALADRDDHRWRGHDGNGRYERHDDRDHDRDRRGHHAGRHDRHDDRHGWRHDDRRDRYGWRHPGHGHGKYKYRYRHDHRFWTHYDRWYRTYGHRHHRPGWHRRDHRIVVIFENWLNDPHGHRHYHGDRYISNGVYLNFPIRIGH